MKMQSTKWEKIVADMFNKFLIYKYVKTQLNIKETIWFLMHRELEYIFFSQRRARDGKQKHEKVLDITNQETQIKTTVRNYFTQNGYVQKDKK